MASERSASSNNLDERLEKTRDNSLVQGEKVIIQAMGDLGQAIVLTDSRVFILKAGITATGSLNGEKATIFKYDEISCVRLRRGPMGAVIQVISTQISDDSQVIPPGNVLVFNGDVKVKKSEAVAAKMKSMGLNVERIGFENEAIQPQTPKIKKVRTTKNKDIEVNEAVVKAEESAIQDNDEIIASKEVTENIISPDEIKPQRAKKVKMSLAEEMYAEITNTDSETENKTQPIYEEQKNEILTQSESIENVPEVVSVNESISYAKTDFDLEPIEMQENVVSQAIIEEISSTEVEEPVDEKSELNLADFRPNPRLPKPVSRVKNNNNQMLVLFVLLAIIVIGGIAYMKPASKPAPKTEVTINIDKLTLSPKSIRKQLEAIEEYKTEAIKIVKVSADASSGFVTAFRSNSKTAQYDDALDNACRDIEALTAPSGLALVKQNLTKALFDRKTVVANAEAGFNENISETINELAKIDQTIKQNFEAIDEACTKLQERSKQTTQKK